MDPAHPTPAHPQALNLRHAEKPWASLLLVGRLGNAHLFAASLQHAAAVYGGKGLAEKDGDASGGAAPL